MTFSQLISGKQETLTNASGADFAVTIQAVQSVSKSYVEFKKIPLQKNIEIARAYQQLYRTKKDELILRLIKDVGYTPSMAERESENSLHLLETLMACLTRETTPVVSLGPCLVYGSWSSPLIRFHQTVLTSLLLGNSVLLLAAPIAAPIYIQLCEILISAGLPASQMAVISSQDPESIDTLIQHPSLRAIHWRSHYYEIGSLRDTIAQTHKKSKIYLGGRNPVIFLHDANLTKLKNDLAQSLDFHYLAEDRHQRWFVQEKVYDTFVYLVKEHLKSPLNDFYGLSLDTTYNQQMEMQKKQLQSERGWQSINSEHSPIALQLSYDFNNCSPWQQQEILGPILTITRFKNAPEAIKFCNTTLFATQASVYCEKQEKFQEVAQQLHMAQVNWNKIRDSHTDKPTFGTYMSGFGNEISDYDFFKYPRISE